ncbi:MAG TPA: lysozyme inhibitor LprI family protein [Chthoniobacteraceae bacterium]|jgi:uncharacterized protein YecT (DUF1311 family)
MSKLPLLIALVLALFATLPAHAEDEKDPIDIAMDAAMERDPSTAGMVQATAAAQKKWEKELARSLARLEEVMEPEEWEALQASQKAWRAFRQQEVKAQGEIYSRMDGSMWVPVSASDAMELVRARALQLRQYAETISER